jgi:hypothetical protein
MRAISMIIEVPQLLQTKDGVLRGLSEPRLQRREKFVGEELADDALLLG